MAWRVAKSLLKLREQINEMSPDRSKISDGTIGDPSHSSRTSDHNPDPGRVVRALDITHDPARGVDGWALASALIASRDPRIKYIISNRKIASGAAGPSPWKWRKYSGNNPHTFHMHLSVVADARADDMTEWRLRPLTAEEVPVQPPQNPLLVHGSKGASVIRLQALLNKHGAKLKLDGDFGPKTLKAVRAFQAKNKLWVDGKVGPYTWGALLGGSNG